MIQIRRCFIPENKEAACQGNATTVRLIRDTQHPSAIKASIKDNFFTDLINIQEDTPEEIKNELKRIHHEHQSVFNNDLRNGYNSAKGRCDADFEFINEARPPVTRGFVPQYTKDKDLFLLQKYIDHLEEMGVCAKATKIGIQYTAVVQ